MNNLQQNDYLLLLLIFAVLILITDKYVLILIPILFILYKENLLNPMLMSLKEKFSVKDSKDSKDNKDNKDNKCQMPTLDNPFMNGLAGDNPTRQEACKSPKVAKISENYLDHNLYKDVNDIYEKHNSQRQFYTNPSTTYPNDREAFMKWCWDTPYACKSGDMNHCLEYEDLRVPGFS